MNRLEPAAPPTRKTSRLRVWALAVSTAVLANLALYGMGRLAGGAFTFTRDGRPTEVDAWTVAGFSAVPLGAGLFAVALLARRLPWAARLAAVVAPVTAVATIGIMTIPADFDTVSTLSLAACHLTLVPVSLAAIRALARGGPAR